MVTIKKCNPCSTEVLKFLQMFKRDSRQYHPASTICIAVMIALCCIHLLELGNAQTLRAVPSYGMTCNVKLWIEFFSRPQPLLRQVGTFSSKGEANEAARGALNNSEFAAVEVSESKNSGLAIVTGASLHPPLSRWGFYAS